MNALHPLAVYAAVCAHRKIPLVYPGDLNMWLAVCEHSSAMYEASDMIPRPRHLGCYWLTILHRLTGYLSEWAVLEEKCRNQKFNASDGSPIPMNRFWPELGRWYGLSEKDIKGPELDESKYTVTNPGNVPTPLG